MKQHSVASLAELVGGQVLGDGDRLIRGVADLHTAGADQLGFVRNIRYLDAAPDCQAGALIVGQEMDTAASQIVVGQVDIAFAKVAMFFHPVLQADRHEVHPTAVVDPGAVLADPVQVGAHAVIENVARIGAGSVIMAGAFVGEDCTLGSNCVLHPRVVLYRGVKLGDRVTIHGGTVVGSDGFGYAMQDHHYIKMPQLGTVVIDDDVEIGANCTIDRGTLGETRIGRGSKVDNLVHVAHNCVLGEDNAIAALSALAGTTLLGNRVALGGHTVTAGHLQLTDDVRVGGNSAIHGDISKSGDYLGHPIMEKRRYGRHLRALRRLVEMYQDRRKRPKTEE